MKTRNILALIVLGCLCSCQQDEQQEQNDAVINFSMSIDNENLDAVLTRSGASSLYDGKKSFSAGDIVSMSTSNNNFSSYTIGKSALTWDEVGINSKEVKFHAHFPEVPSVQTQGKRILQGGKEHLFGLAAAISGAKNIAMEFKRMTVPVILLDDNGMPYNGPAIVKLHVKNQGLQDLNEGFITVDNSVPAEDIEIQKVANGNLTNLLPQEIKAGDKLATITLDGETTTVRATANYSMKAGRTLSLRVSKDRVTGGGIIENDTPLRR